MFSDASQNTSSPRLRAHSRNARVEAIVIGASLGGPQAVSTVLRYLAPHIDHIVVYVVIHMPSDLAVTLTAQLASVSTRHTQLCVHGDVVKAGHIYIAPGNMHMRIVRVGTKILTLHDDRSPQHFCKPSVDVTFNSFATTYGANGLALVLTGMGQDGLVGSQSIVEHGGKVFVQDEASSAVWGMPGSVAKAGLASLILPPAELAKAAALHLIHSAPGGAFVTDWIKRLQSYLHRRSGVLLDADKLYFIESRLAPLVKTYQETDVESLFYRLERSGDRQLERAFIDSFLTNETFFFRDRMLFETIRNRLLPQLSQTKEKQRQIRFWCAACSTGQEAYSLAMVVDEEMSRFPGWSIDILATDLSDRALQSAKAGLYTNFEVQRGLPIQYLLQHFKRVGERWQIQDQLRSRIKFEIKNLIDPFHEAGKFDLILCRNVLIYFDEPTRRHILKRLSQSLHAEGCLALGSSETLLANDMPGQTWTSLGAGLWKRVSSSVESRSTLMGREKSWT